MNTSCDFCREHLDPTHSTYYNILGQKIGVNSRILLETDNWYAVPTLGCLKVGYVLLICKHHYLSAANLPFELYKEMLSIKERVEETLFNKLQNHCICFEHGVTSSLYTGANSVDHIHLHIVPFASNVWPKISEMYHLTNFENIADYYQLFSLWNHEYPNTYLLFQDTNGPIYYKPNATDYPSQFFRECLSSLLKEEQWNWKKEVYEENFLATLSLFK